MNPKDGSLASEPPVSPSRRRYASPGTRPIRHATGPQLWRLNQQRLLRLVDVTDELFVPGGPLECVPAIEQADATVLLDRLVSVRWAGLGRWPKAGEAWRVRNGLVVLEAALEDVS